MSERRYVVYRHTSPEGKVYIGITSQKKPEYRWGEGGSGYRSNSLFWYDIQKFGWDNFQHEILNSDLKEHEARHMESELIHLHKATKPEFGYNQDAGHLYRDEDSSLLKLKRHFAGKQSWMQSSQTAQMKLAMSYAQRAIKNRGGSSK